MRCSPLFRASSALALALAGMALDAAPASAQQLEEVIVTARRTEERLQDTPVSVAAFTAADIRRKNIEGLSDVARLTPGLTFESYSTGAFSNPTIRGATQTRTDFADQNVSSFFDGIYLPRQYVADLGVFNLQRVEVVKGPQSALYGRSAFAGAINYIPLQPTRTFTAEGFGTVGQYDRRDIYGTFAGPIIPDKLMFRIGAGYSQFDGTGYNPNPLSRIDYHKGSSGRLGGWVKSNEFAQLKATPFEQLELNVAYYHFNTVSESASDTRYHQADNTLNCGNRAANGNYRLYCGQIPYSEAAYDPKTTGFTLNSNIVRASLDYHITPDLTLSFIHGRIRAAVDSNVNADSDPRVGQVFFGQRVNLYFKTPSGYTHMRSDELRLRYNRGPLALVGGLYTQKQRDRDTFIVFGYPVNNLPLEVQTPLIRLPLQNGALANTDLDAVFGEATYRFLDDRASIDVQARYSREKKSLRPSPTTSSTIYEKTYKYFTPRMSVDYKMTPDNLVYASVAKGVKSGGFNGTVYDPTQRAYNPDTNWTYELGSKNTFLDHRLRLNGAIYYIDWTNIQTNVAVRNVPPGITAPSLIGNGKGVNIPGFEVETEYVFGGGLTLNGSIAYQRARFKNGYVSQRAVDLGLCAGSTVCPTNGDASGKPLARSPELQLAAGFDFERKVREDAAFYVRGDYSFQSKQYIDDLGLAWIGSRPLANASLGMTFQGGRYELQLWSKNIFDKKYVAAANFVPGATEVQYTPNMGPRRTFGVTGRFNY